VAPAGRPHQTRGQRRRRHHPPAHTLPADEQGAGGDTETNNVRRPREARQPESQTATAVSTRPPSPRLCLEPPRGGRSPHAGGRPTGAGRGASAAGPPRHAGPDRSVTPSPPHARRRHGRGGRSPRPPLRVAAAPTAPCRRGGHTGVGGRGGTPLDRPRRCRPATARGGGGRRRGWGPPRRRRRGAGAGGCAAAACGSGAAAARRARRQTHWRAGRQRRA